jgi:TPR repeat protein
MGVLVEESPGTSGADALKWYEASCKLENVEGCERAGIVVSQSADQGDREEAAALLVKACGGGRGLACLLAAELGGDLAATVALKEKAEHSLRMTCESGKGQECFWLSEAIGEARLAGTQADAASLRRRACALGIREACAPQ